MEIASTHALRSRSKVSCREPNTFFRVLEGLGDSRESLFGLILIIGTSVAAAKF